MIRARLAGAHAATGDVLVFLDAHCEGVVEWMEPLLARIQESRTSVLVPIIDVIDAKDFHYSINGYKHFQVGGFTWNGHFDWINIPKREKQRILKECRHDAEICPTYSPTMAGGLFAIDRKVPWVVVSSLPLPLIIIAHPLIFDSSSGKSVHTTKKWMAGAVKTWKCRSAFGNVSMQRPTDVDLY